MPQWIVEGADSKTGADRKLSISAPDREEAERRARGRGLLVSGVELISPPAAPTPDPNLGEGPLDYRRAELAPPRAPEYKELIRGSRELRILGFLMEVTGALLIIGGVLAVMIGVSSGSYPLIAAAPALFLCGVGWLFFGVLVRALAGALTALRRHRAQQL